jgi:hypothetical protein
LKPCIEKLNVSPVVNIQLGAAWLMPRRRPASRDRFCHGACQMTPKSAELFGELPLRLSTSISPTSLSFGVIGNSAIRPQIAKGSACATIDATAEVYVVDQRLELSAQSPDSFKTDAFFVLIGGWQKWSRLDGEADAIFLLQDAFLNDCFHRQRCIDERCRTGGPVLRRRIRQRPQNCE